MAKKYLFLNGVEEKALKTSGVAQVKRNGISYKVEKVGDDVIITPMTQDIVIIAPLDLPKGALILTHDENRELRETGKTIHTKGGIVYDIVSVNGTPRATVKCEYTDIILKSEC